MHDIVGLLFHVASEAGVEEASGLETDVPEGAEIVDCTREQSERPVINVCGPAGRRDVQRIARIRRLAERKGQRALRGIGPVPVRQNNVLISGRPCRRAQDAVEEVEKHAVPGEEIEGPVLALVPALRLLHIGRSILGAVDVGLEPVARRICDGPTHHHLDAGLQCGNLGRRQARYALPGERLKKGHA